MCRCTTSMLLSGNKLAKLMIGRDAGHGASPQLFFEHQCDTRTPSKDKSSAKSYATMAQLRDAFAYGKLLRCHV